MSKLTEKHLDILGHHNGKNTVHIAKEASKASIQHTIDALEKAKMGTDAKTHSAINRQIAVHVSELKALNTLL